MRDKQTKQFTKKCSNYNNITSNPDLTDFTVTYWGGVHFMSILSCVEVLITDRKEACA